MTWFEDQDPIVQSVIIACGTYITKGIAAWWADRKEKQNLDTAGRNEKEKLDKEREVQRTRTDKANRIEKQKLDKEREVQRTRTVNEYKLKRIDYKISKVIGPLRGLLIQNKSVFNELKPTENLHKQDQPKDKTGLTPRQSRFMRLMKDVIHPRNIEIRQILLHSDFGFERLEDQEDWKGAFEGALVNISEWDVILSYIEQKRPPQKLTPANPWPYVLEYLIEKEHQNLANDRKKIIRAMEGDQLSMVAHA